MKRIHDRRWLTAVRILGIGIVVSACGTEDPGTEAPASTSAAAPPPRFEIQNIEGDLYQAGVRGGGGGHTTVFLVTPDGVILADPINAGFAEWLKNEFRERFDAQVEYVLYSHHHPDHASGGSVFADTATFVAHGNMAVALTGLPSNSVPMDTNGNGVIERSEARSLTLAGFDRDDTDGDGALSAAEVNAHTYPPDIIYQDQMTIRFGGATVEMHHAPPAHTDDMSVLLFPDYDVVFVVDFLQINRFPGGLSGFLAGYPVDNYEIAIDSVKALDFDTVIQGHSELIGTRSDIDAFLTLLRTTEAEVANAVAAGRSREETLETVMLPAYSDWLVYETRRPALVGNMYDFLSQE